MKYLDLVILAGGKGTRIKSYTKNKPKPLANIGNYIFLDLLLGNISKYHFRKIFILAGYKGDQIYKKYHNKNINFMNIECIVEKEPLGTGGGIKTIKGKLTKDFFVINGDTIADFNFYEMVKLKKNNNSVIALTKSQFNNNGNIIKNLYFDKQKKIEINNLKKRNNFKSAGVCLLSKSIFNDLDKKKFSLEDEVIFNLIQKKKLCAYTNSFFFYDIGTRKDFQNAGKKLLNFLRRPAIFFDRDNTLNLDKGYTYKFSNFEFINNSFKALKYASNKKFYIFIVTNQAGIGKGHFTEKDFVKLHIKLKKKFLNNKIFIHDVKYCPYHPMAKLLKFKKKSSLRKPGNLMITQILKQWVINKKISVMIGDQVKDKKCAEKSNLNFKFVEKDLLKQLKNLESNRV